MDIGLANYGLLSNPSTETRSGKPKTTVGAPYCQECQYLI